MRAADPGKGKGKGKGRGLKKKDKNKRKEKNLKKSDKKNGDKKKRGKKNGTKRGKKNGKGKKKKKKNGLKKKKSRKNKSKSKGKNKDRKKKKARKAAKKEKKKDRKRKNNRKANTARNSTSSSCMDATCINNAVTYMKQLKLAVKNFGKQYNRITTNAKQTSGKAGKHSEFDPYLTKLRETGGGNTSNLLCHGKKNTNLQTLYDNLATCKTIINNTCHTNNMPAVNMTSMDACKATMDGFVNETDKAIKATGSAGCLIWESEKLANMSAMLKDCSLKETEWAHTAAKKACTGNFSFCRQEEDKVSKLVSACSASNSEEKVTAAIAQGKKNEAAATALSTKVNTTLGITRTRTGTIASRSTDVTCADFATKVAEVSIHVTTAPLLANLETLLTALAESTVAACSDDDKSNLGKASTTFLSSTESITLAISEKQSALTISTGNTINPEIATVAATTVTTTNTGTTGTSTKGTTTATTTMGTTTVTTISGTTTTALTTTTASA